MILELRPPRFGRASTLLVLIVLGYLFNAGSLTIGETAFVGADGARFCAAAQRHANGDGLTVISARTVGEIAELPTAYESASPWPRMLGVLAGSGGDVATTASWCGLIALLLITVAWPVFLWRSLRIPGWAAMLATVPVVCHPAVFAAALDPRGGSVFLLIMTAIAITASQWRVREMVPAAVVAGVLAALIPGPVTGVSGLSYAIGPLGTDLGMVITVALLVVCITGLAIWPRIPELLPTTAMGMGHVVGLFLWPGTQIGMPLVLVASGITATVLVHSRGPVLLLGLILAAVATAVAAPGPGIVTAVRAELTGNPALAMALDQLDAEAIPEDSVVLTPAADELARRLQRATVTTSRLQWESETVASQLVESGVTHVLLLWNATDQKPVSDRMDALARDLSPQAGIVVQDFVLDDAGRKSGFRLLRLAP